MEHSIANDFNIGTNPAIEARHGLYKSSIGVVWGLNDPIYSSTTRNIYVFWSDTGEDWTQQNAPAGDELWNQYELNVALGGGYTSNHEYFMVYNGGKFTFSLWAIQEAKKINTLTFPGDVSANPDLNYFEVGDAVIAGSDGKTWTGTTANANNYGVSDPAILFDGTTGALSQITSDKYLGSGNDADEHTITFNPPITNDSGNVWMYAVREVNSGTFKINNIDVSVSGNSNWMYVDCGTFSVSSLTFGARASNSGYVSGVQFFSMGNAGVGRVTREQDSQTRCHCP